jgi:hypothetical protein
MDGSGVIYRHIYKLDGRSYIGQSVNEKERTNSHRKSKDPTYFHRAVRKYGWENFITEILHENIDMMYLDDWEIYYISKYDTFGKNGFNMTRGGGGIRGYKHTEEHKRWLSLSNSGENNPFFNKKHSDESLFKQSKSKMGIKNPNFGIIFSEEHKEKLARSHLKPIEQWTSNGEEYIKTYNSISIAAETIGRSPTGISQCLAGKQKTSGGFFWKYVV